MGCGFGREKMFVPESGKESEKKCFGSEGGKKGARRLGCQGSFEFRGPWAQEALKRCSLVSAGAWLLKKTCTTKAAESSQAPIRRGGWPLASSGKKRLS